MRDRTRELEKVKKQLAKLQGRQLRETSNDESDRDDVSGADDMPLQPQQQEFDDQSLSSNLRHSTGIASTSYWGCMPPFWQSSLDGITNSITHPVLSGSIPFAKTPQEAPMHCPTSPTTGNWLCVSTRSHSRRDSRGSIALSRASTRGSSTEPSSCELIMSPSITRHPSVSLPLSLSSDLKVISHPQAEVALCNIQNGKADDHASAGAFELLEDQHIQHRYQQEPFWTRPAESDLHTSSEHMYPPPPAFQYPSLPASSTTHSHFEPSWHYQDAVAALNSNTSGFTCSSSQPDEANSTLLHSAVVGNNVESMQHVPRDYARIPMDAHSSAGHNTLHRAMLAGRMDMVKMLLDTGVDRGICGSFWSLTSETDEDEPDLRGSYKTSS
jgi:hypothetical protein